jgi:hypothetical protein
MNATRTIKRSIAGAATAAAFFAFAACGEDAPTQDITNVDTPSENSDFAPKYGEHSDEFVKKGPADGSEKAPGDFQP